VPRAISALIGGLGRYGVAVFSPLRAARLRSSRTHACTSNNLPRAIHKFDSANKVVSCAVFFFSPR
jgi:hypothetical protein